jgi:nucleoid-associated protein EbfC
MLKGGMDGLMKQAQEMQSKFQEMQDKMAQTEVQGEAGAGLVTVIMTGRHDVKRVTIDPSVLEEEKSLLEDLLAAAVNDAVRKLESEQQASMSTLTGGIPLPPGFKFPFSA